MVGFYNTTHPMVKAIFNEIIFFKKTRFQQISTANPFQDRFKRPLSGRMVCYGPPTRLHWDGCPAPVCVEPKSMVVRQHMTDIRVFKVHLD